MAAGGDWEAVKRLLASGADPTLLDCQGFTALHHAVFNDHLSVVRTLLADTEPRLRRESLLAWTTTRGVSCLHLASQQGYEEIVSFLVQAGSESLLHKTAQDGSSCLYMASHQGHLEVVKVLANAGG